MIDMSNATLDFISSQRAVWGDDYVDDLIDRKYFPVLTSAGWKWIYVSDENYANTVHTALDTATVVW